MFPLTVINCFSRVRWSHVMAKATMVPQRLFSLERIKCLVFQRNDIPRGHLKFLYFLRTIAQDFVTCTSSML